MATSTFFCVDAHTCGNPVRVVAGGAPRLIGDTLAACRQHFLEEYDWIRKGLMFEPRGHDLMSGSIVYPPLRPDCDVGLLYIETSGCLPMCGHGAIGSVTVIIEQGLASPAMPGLLRLETPAGRVDAHYQQKHGRVTSVKIVNVPSFLYAENLAVVSPDLGSLTVDVGYGGNFYAIVDTQPNFPGIDHFSASDLIRMARSLRTELNRLYTFKHPLDDRIAGLSHIEWTGPPNHPDADARNAVFYGSNAIDRSPCGTGTSARMAQWFARGKLAVGDRFVHESIIGSLFTGRVEEETTVGSFKAIIPSIEGWARITGYNTIFIDEEDPFAQGFQVV